MKIGRNTITSTEVHLPAEVLYNIIAQVRSQRTLWACCLVAKLWYATAVGRLYERPRLCDANFDHFCRTICSRGNPRAQSTSLENFIKHLDMMAIASGSYKSVTARLLRRIRASLESFDASPVSFSYVKNVFLISSI